MNVVERWKPFASGVSLLYYLTPIESAKIKVGGVEMIR